MAVDDTMTGAAVELLEAAQERLGAPARAESRRGRVEREVVGHGSALT